MANNLSGQFDLVSAIEGTPLPGDTDLASFTDGTLTDNSENFVANIDWGDGTTTAGTLSGSGGSFTVTGSHTYATAGNFTITTFMNDDTPDSASAVATTQADVGFGGTEVFSAAQETIAVPTGTTVA